MPKVSVIIPAYNTGPFVAEAVRSALEQTYRDSEVIVVNDGSTDSTSAELERFEGQIVYLEQAHRGVSHARNRALEKASGDLIALLDSDDVWVPDRLERVVETVNANPAFSIVCTDAFVLGDEPGTDGTYYSRRPRRLRFRHNHQSYWIVHYNFILGFAVFRRRCIDEHGAFDESLRTFEDWDLWLRFVTRGERALLLGEPLGYYRMHDSNLTSEPLQMIDDEVALLEKAAGDPVSARTLGIRGRLDFAKAKRAFARGDKRDGAELFRAAATDRGLPGEIRLRALGAGMVPGLAARSYRLSRIKR